MDKCQPLKAFLNASVKAGKLSDFWGLFNKTIIQLQFTSVAIVLESKNNSYKAVNYTSVKVLLN